MIHLHTCNTANGYRASIMLEECALPYVVHAIDLAKGDQRTPAFLAINPLARVPVIVDDAASDGGSLALSECLAIAQYLAAKANRLMPGSARGRAVAAQWGAIVVSGFSAAAAGIFFARQLGAQAHAPLIGKLFADIDLYLAAMEGRLRQSPYLAGDAISYADLLAIPTLVRSLPAMQVDLSRYEAIRRWSATVASREAVIRGLAVPGTAAA